MESQAEVLAFLSDPGNHGGQIPQRIDTHISAVFLAGDHALKLKKAVTLPFLDFAPPLHRKAACEAELAVNRRVTPALYLGLRTITRAASGGLEWDGQGDAVDWVVDMRRFDQTSLFDRLAEAGRLDRETINALTESITDFHRRAPIRTDKGGADGLSWTIETNRDAMLAHSPAILDKDMVERLAVLSRTALTSATPRLLERRERGMVRWCHGDLHLGNICILDGAPALFDAIEFSEDIACIDVLYDLAFLLMDLDHRGQRQAANWVLNHHLDLTGDFTGMALMPLFLSARAAIRAHVLATMAAQVDGDLKSRQTVQARAYLDAALAYLTPPPARLVAVGGLSGSGKSRMAREVAPFLGVPGAAVVRSDSLRKHLMGVGLLDRLGPEGYTPEVTEKTYGLLQDTCAALLADGVPVVADAVFARPDQRAAIEAVAAKAGVPFNGLWLEAPERLSSERIQARKANVSDATPDVLKRQHAFDLGTITWPRVESSGTKEETLVSGMAVLGLAGQV